MIVICSLDACSTAFLPQCCAVPRKLSRNSFIMWTRPEWLSGISARLQLVWYQVRIPTWKIKNFSLFRPWGWFRSITDSNTVDPIQWYKLRYIRGVDHNSNGYRFSWWIIAKSPNRGKCHDPQGFEDYSAKGKQNLNHNPCLLCKQMYTCSGNVRNAPRNLEQKKNKQKKKPWTRCRWLVNYAPCPHGSGCIRSFNICR